MKNWRGIVALLLTLALASCENVFHNDSLDFMWRLDKVEYAGGVDFSGNACDRETKQGLWVSFARDLVEIQNTGNYFGTIGILTDYGDSLKFDFSMCTGTPMLDKQLEMFGIGSQVSTYRKETPDRREMVLTGDRTTLYFTKW